MCFAVARKASSVAACCRRKYFLFNPGLTEKAIYISTINTLVIHISY
jgi:hypothetical protein